MSQINSSLPSIDRLVEAFQRLPGIGPKSAQRLTYHLIKMKREESEELASAALGVKTITLMADTPLIYGSYSSKMYPIIPDGEETVGHNTLGKEKINPEKIFEIFKKIII